MELCRVVWAGAGLAVVVGAGLDSAVRADESEAARAVAVAVQTFCQECHDGEDAEGGLDLSGLAFDLSDRLVRERWVRIHNRVQQGEMPPDRATLPDDARRRFVATLGAALHAADFADVLESGRGPLRRLNRDEYQQNLRDILELPQLDIRDMLPADRISHHFDKTAESLDVSRVQLAAYLDAAEAALHAAVASGVEPPPTTKFRAVGRALFSETSTFGNREAMFFARDSRAIDPRQLDEKSDDPAIEMALFRSAHWPYYGYPRSFVVRLPGEYRVRFSARAVLQLRGFELKPAEHPQPMTFRARRPSGPDVSGDVRATGGLIDVQTEQAEYATTIRLREGETFEYSLLGLPVPLARNVNGGPPTYRYPPFPEGGQPGVAFQWLEVEGPIAPQNWPPPSHGVLFDQLPVEPASDQNSLPVNVVSSSPEADLRRLLRRFVERAAREPVSDETLGQFEQLAVQRLEQGVPLGESLVAAYKAFLCSSQFLYLPEPVHPETSAYSIAARLSHFLTNTRPDEQLAERAHDGELQQSGVVRDETRRLIQSRGFERFVVSFTDGWLNLRHVYRDEPDARLYPEYRFDAYLIESMERETRAFFSLLVRENLPVSTLIHSDFVLANDRLALHYRLPMLNGSALQQVPLPLGSPYGGLLTQGAILKVTANGTATSPVIRGAWITDRLLGQPPPPPPASVPAVEPDIRGAKTIRELLALHTKDASCAGCHARFDPVGLALENFDVLGGWRDRYRGVEAGDAGTGIDRVVTGIDRAGHDFQYTLTSPVDSAGRLLDRATFRDIHSLKELLLRDERQLARNLLQQFVTYATGTPVRFSDRAEIEALLDRCAGNGFRVQDLLVALVESRIFQGVRRADDETVNGKSSGRKSVGEM